MERILLGVIIAWSTLAGIGAAYQYGFSYVYTFKYILLIYIMLVVFATAIVNLYFVAPNVFEQDMWFIPKVRYFVKDKSSLFNSVKHVIKIVARIIISLFGPFISMTILMSFVFTKFNIGGI